MFTLDPLEGGESARQHDRRRALHALLLAFSAAAILWWIKLIEWLMGWDFSGLGVRPHDAFGLLGILLAPLIHGSFQHLVANTVPLVMLGFLALYFYPRASSLALPLVWLIGGAGVWLFGRSSLHFGASGIGHGLLFFVFVMGILRRDRRAIAAAMLAFGFYGGMLLTIFPREPEVSWEYHLFGAIGGALAAVIGRKRDPLPPRKKYSWDYEDEWQEQPADEYELPRPTAVPVLWQRPEPEDERGATVIPFPRERARGRGDGDDSQPPPTLH